MRRITIKSQKMQNEILNIFHVNVIYNHSLWPELSIMLSSGGSQSPACGLVHAGESLIFDVTGGIIFMCRVWCKCKLDVDKHGRVSGSITDYLDSVQYTLSNVANCAATD